MPMNNTPHGYQRYKEALREMSLPQLAVERVKQEQTAPMQAAASLGAALLGLIARACEITETKERPAVSFSTLAAELKGCSDCDDADHQDVQWAFGLLEDLFMAMSSDRKVALDAEARVTEHPYTVTFRHWDAMSTLFDAELVHRGITVEAMPV